MSKGINFKWPLRAHNKGFFAMNETTLDAVKENIKILLLTRKGERAINPDIGTNISVLGGELFNNIQPQEMKLRITSEIKDAFAQWLPGIELTKLNIFTSDDDPSLKPTHMRVRLDFRLKNAEALSDSVLFNITT